LFQNLGISVQMDELASCSGVSIGGPCAGLNKRSSERPLFEEAYSLALVQSVEWIQACEKWTQASHPKVLVSSFKSFRSPYHSDSHHTEGGYINSLRDLAASLQYGSRQNGIWKGSASGDLNRMLGSFSTFFKIHFPTSPLAILFGKGTIRRLVSDLYNKTNTAVLSYDYLAQVSTVAIANAKMATVWGEPTGFRYRLYKLRLLEAEMLDRSFWNWFPPSLQTSVGITTEGTTVPHVTAPELYTDKPSPLYWTVLHFSWNSHVKASISLKNSNLRQPGNIWTDTGKIVDVNRYAPNHVSLNIEGTDAVVSEAHWFGDSAGSKHNNPSSAYQCTGETGVGEYGRIKTVISVVPLSTTEECLAQPNDPANSTRVQTNLEAGVVATSTNRGVCANTAAAQGLPPLCTNGDEDLLSQSVLTEMVVWPVILWVSYSAILMFIIWRVLKLYHQRRAFFSPQRFWLIMWIKRTLLGGTVKVNPSHILRNAAILQLQQTLETCLVPTIGTLPQTGELYQVEHPTELTTKVDKSGQLVLNNWRNVIFNYIPSIDPLRRDRKYAVEYDTPEVDDGAEGVSPAYGATGGAGAYGATGGEEESPEEHTTLRDTVHFYVRWVDGQQKAKCTSRVSIDVWPVQHVRLIPNLREWSRILLAIVLCHTLELVMFLVWGLCLIALYAGEYDTCSPSGLEAAEVPDCLGPAMTGGLTFDASLQGLASVLGGMWFSGVIGPIFGICTILTAQDCLELLLLIYLVINFAMLHIGYISFYAFLRPLHNSLTGYCQGITHSCQRCPSGTSVATCLSNLEAFQARLDCGLTDCTMDCVYSGPVHDSICSTGGFEGRIRASEVCFIIIILLKLISVAVYLFAHGCPELDPECKVHLSFKQETWENGLEEAAEIYFDQSLKQHDQEHDEQTGKVQGSKTAWSRVKRHAKGEVKDLLADIKNKHEALQASKIVSYFEEFGSVIERGFTEETPPSSLLEDDPMAHVLFVYYMQTRRSFLSHRGGTEEANGADPISAVAEEQIRLETAYRFVHPISLSEKYDAPALRSSQGPLSSRSRQPLWSLAGGGDSPSPGGGSALAMMETNASIECRFVIVGGGKRGQEEVVVEVARAATVGGMKRQVEAATGRRASSQWLTVQKTGRALEDDKEPVEALGLRNGDRIHVGESTTREPACVREESVREGGFEEAEEMSSRTISMSMVTPRGDFSSPGSTFSPSQGRSTWLEMNPAQDTGYTDPEAGFDFNFDGDS